MNINEAIELVEETFQLKLSKEQIAILKNDPNKPLLVNACAGSGKTTLYLISVIVRALIGKQNPKNVLGITFSKKAQLDMQKRYDENVERLSLKVPFAQTWENPTFRTFHALFLRLLKTVPQYSDVKVLSSWHNYFFPLAKKLDLSDTQLTTEEYLEAIFNCRDRLINFTYSLDGLTPNSNNKIVQNLTDNSGKINIDAIINYVNRTAMDDNFFKNYKNLITAYNQIKTDNCLIDFNDMKVKLLSVLEDNSVKQVPIDYMKKYTQVYVDEFQDIDPLQWVLIKKLLSKDTFNHLFVIGDDDQSIYSFRGSSPYYITNFSTKLVPTANVLNLSTNYRTGGKILELAKPIITENKVRLDKSLKANNTEGKISIIDERWTAKSVFFNQLKNALHNLSQKNAILVRFNRDKTIIADRLATEGYYVNVGQKSYIFQNTPVYKLFFGLIESFLDDDAKQYIRFSNKLGFTAYKRQLNNVMGTKPTNSLRELIKTLLGDIYDEYLDKKMSKGKSKFRRHRNQNDQIELAEDTLDMLNAVENSNHDLEFQQNELSLLLFSYIKDMTKSYFNYMYSKNVYSKVATQEAINRFGSLLQSTPNWADFKAKEDRKKAYLELMIKEQRQLPNLQLLTMHQSKGLEFDSVFIYGLTDDVLDKNKISLNVTCPSNISIVEFRKLLTTAQNADTTGRKLFLLLKLFADCGVVQTTNIFAKMLNVECDTSVVDEQINKLKQNFTKCKKNFDVTKLPLTGKNFKLLYYQVKNVSADVEEERRLLYVAITRAKKEIYIDMPKENPSPLTKDLRKAMRQLSKKSQ